MNYKIWDKKEKINNVDAEYVIESLKIRDTDEVFLILDNVDEVQAIEIDRIIIGAYNLDANLTVDEVAKEYIRIKEEEKLQAESYTLNLEEQAKKISILESENKELRKELNQIQVSLASLVSAIEK